MTRPFLSRLDEYVGRVITEFALPGGFAVAALKGKRTLVHGYGMREMGGNVPIDEHTLFQLASVAKPLTATLVMLAVERHLIELDRLITDYLPGFQLYDPSVTSLATVRDVLSHGLGLGAYNGDMLRQSDTRFTREDMVYRMRFLVPTGMFRDFGYSNIGYVVVGAILEVVTGNTWEDLLTEWIFNPLGMNESLASLGDDYGGRAATPHLRIDGVDTPIMPFTNANNNPHGGGLVTASDALKLLFVLAHKGKLPDGGRLYSEESAREMETLVLHMDLPPFPANMKAMEPSVYGYGLGREVHVINGQRVYQHGGWLPGFTCDLIYGDGFGLLVLSNQESFNGLRAVSWHILGRLINLPGTNDWIPIRLEREKVQLQRAAALRQTSSAHCDGSCTLDLSRITGVYEDPVIGEIIISGDTQRGFTISFAMIPLLSGTLRPCELATMLAEWPEHPFVVDANAYVDFAFDAGETTLRFSPVLPEVIDASFAYATLRPVWRRPAP